MHQIIKILAIGEDKDEAYENAKHVLEDRLLCHQGVGPWDYGTGFADDEDSSVSGAARYGDRGKAVKLDTEKGLRDIGRALRASERETKRSWSRVKDIFERLLDERDEEVTIEEIAKSRGDPGTKFKKNPFDEDSAAETVTMLGFYLRAFNDRVSAETYLYDHHGNAIPSRKAFDNKIEYVRADVHEEADVWVVPFDVHC